MPSLLRSRNPTHDPLRLKQSIKKESLRNYGTELSSPTVLSPQCNTPSYKAYLPTPTGSCEDLFALCKKKTSKTERPLQLPAWVYRAFDMVVPTAAFGAVALCFLGPLIFPKAYLLFLLSYFCMFFYFSCAQLYRFRKSSQKIIHNISNPINAHISHVHVFIIPNYAEPLPLLRKTIDRLAGHTFAAEQYVIVLGMEETEEGCEEKAEILCEEFSGKFRDIIVSVHPKDIPGESRGKGSNVNHACRYANKVLTSRGIPLKQLIVTVSDSDAAIPELYINHLEKELSLAEDPYKSVFCPPIFFGRNAHQIPAAVRATDITWSVMVMQNLSNTQGVMFPASSYSLSMTLCENVGYWDTGFDAIGEDLHMMLKCFYKGDARAVPIFVPLNFTNIQAETYATTLKARYTQAKRHYYGLSDVSYALRQTMETPVSSSVSTMYARALCCMRVLEAQLLPATSGYFVMLSTLVFEFLRPDFLRGEWLLVFNAIQLFASINVIPLLCSFIYYEMLHKKLDEKMWGGAGRSWGKIFDYLWLPVSAFFFMTVPSTEACIKLWKGGEGVYVVSEKMGEE